MKNYISKISFSKGFLIKSENIFKFSLWILKDYKIFCTNSKIWFFLNRKIKKNSFFHSQEKFINKLYQNDKTNCLNFENDLLSEIEKKNKKKQTPLNFPSIKKNIRQTIVISRI